MKDLSIYNNSKLIFSMLVIICVTGLLIANRITDVAGVGLIGTVSGYILGNGVAAITGHKVDPIIGNRTYTDTHELTKEVE